MKVKDLIEELRGVPQDCAVSVWINGDRHWAFDTDASFVESENFFEINVTVGA